MISWYSASTSYLIDSLATVSRLWPSFIVTISEAKWHMLLASIYTPSSEPPFRNSDCYVVYCPLISLIPSKTCFRPIREVRYEPNRYANCSLIKRTAKHQPILLTPHQLVWHMHAVQCFMGPSLLRLFQYKHGKHHVLKCDSARLG
jgi:hypothetical protein